MQVKYTYGELAYLYHLQPSNVVEVLYCIAQEIENGYTIYLNCVMMKCGKY